MNDDNRRLLTEYMGKCWHERGRKIGAVSASVYECEKCNEAFHPLSGYRTFTTGQDLYDLYRKMVEKGDWDEFYNWIALREDADYKEQVFSAWLFDVDRIPLVVEWIKAQREAQNDS